MEAKYLFLALTLSLTIGLAFILNEGSRNEIIAHWSERRCDFDVLLSSFLYKPSDDSRSSSEFAADNFNFCVTSKTATYLQTIFGVLFEVLRKQFAASDIMTQVFKVLRVQLNSIYEPFAAFMNRFYVKFMQVGFLTSRVFQHLYMAMKKAAATAIASIFVAMSLQTSFLNGIDLVIKVIMIFLYILMGLAFIFFLPILPFLVIVLITVSGIESAMPGSTGPMGSVFCFYKATPVQMSDGKCKPISQIKPDDILQDTIRVQSVIQVPWQTLYEIDGISVSGYHQIYHNGKAIYVKDHPRAIKSKKEEQTLWTLVTDKRIIPVMGSKGTLKFMDWDEIPDTRLAQIAWDIIVYEMLNNEECTDKRAPFSAPCLDRTIQVLVSDEGWKPLSEIKIGHSIYGINGWTKVVGKCERIVEIGLNKDGNWISDGNWILNEKGKWDHIFGNYEDIKWQGLQLITDSGVFKIKMKNGKEYIVRDFTEVGLEKIAESDTRVESLLETVQPE
jgi:hypothetical protein